jgi:hypothetical protein
LPWDRATSSSCATWLSRSPLNCRCKRSFPANRVPGGIGSPARYFPVSRPLASG